MSSTAKRRQAPRAQRWPSDCCEPRIHWLQNLADHSRMASESDFFFYTRRLAAAFAQIVQFRPAHISASLDFDAANRLAVGLKHPLDALTVRNFTHRERRIQSAISLGNDDTFVCLQSLTAALSDANLNDYRIARRKIWNLAFHLFRFQFINDLAHKCSPSRYL